MTPPSDPDQPDRPGPADASPAGPRHDDAADAPITPGPDDAAGACGSDGLDRSGRPGADRPTWPEVDGVPLVPPAPPASDAPEPAWDRQAWLATAGRAGTWPRRRLHRAAVAIWTLEQAVGLLAAFAIILLSAGVPPLAWLGVPIGLLVIGTSVGLNLARWWRFTWQVQPDAVVIERGLVFRQRRVIRRERIQAVDVVRRLRHRPFGVVEVRIEAIGSGGTEGELSALAPHDARALRRELLGSSAGDDAVDASVADDVGDPGGPPTAGDDEAAGRFGAEPGVEQLARVPAGRLVVAGLTGGRVGVAAALLGVASQVLGPQLGERIPELVESAPVRLTVLTVLAVLVGAFLLSLVATVVTFWDFRLAHDGERLRVRYGLLAQRSATVPLRRVQSVRVEENLVRRMLGLAAVRVDVAGRSGEDEQQTSMVLPLGTAAQARGVAERIIGAPGALDADLAGAPRRALRRRLVRAVLVTAAVTVPAAWLAWPAGLAAAALVLPAGAVAVAAWRALGVGDPGGMTVTRAGWLLRATAVVPDDRIQSLEISASPLQRLRRLATVDLQIARSAMGGWGGPQAIDRDEREAVEICERLAGRAARARAAFAEPDAAASAPGDEGG